MSMGVTEIKCTPRPAKFSLDDGLVLLTNFAYALENSSIGSSTTMSTPTKSILKKPASHVQPRAGPSRHIPKTGSKLRQSFVMPKPALARSSKKKPEPRKREREKDDVEGENENENENENEHEDEGGKEDGEDVDMDGEENDGSGSDEEEEEEVGTDGEISQAKVGEKRKTTTTMTTSMFSCPYLLS